MNCKTISFLLVDEVFKGKVLVNICIDSDGKRGGLSMPLVINDELVCS